jgi:hypothetical protein
MKELDLLVENYFTPALNATDILRLVEQIMEEGVLNEEVLSFPQLAKRDNLRTFIKKIEKSEPFELTDGGTATFKAQDDILAALKKMLASRDISAKAAKILLGKKFYLTTTDEDIVHLNALQKTGEFGGSGSTASELKISNKGDVLEGLLGVALFISLKGEVPTNESIIATLEELRKEEDNSKSKNKISKSLTETITRSVDKEDRKVDVTLNIALNIGNFNDMMNSEKRSLLQTEYSNVIKYAESDYFKDVKDELIFDKNAPPNNVTINVVGALEQTTSKADLRILKDGNVVLSQSLKNGSRTLGQVGGKKEEMVFDFIKRVFDKDFPSNLKKYYIKLLTEKCDAGTSRRNILWVVNDMFNYIYTHAQGKLNDGDYKKHLMSALSYAALGDAQGDDATIELLNFEKNEFRLLDFKKVMSDSLLDGLSLGLDFNHTGGFPEGPNPEPPKLTIFDTNNGTDDKPSSANRLFQFRPKYENKNCYFRFYLEYGNRIDAILMDAFEEGQAKKRQQIIDREEDASV